MSDAFWERVEPLIPQPAARSRKQTFVRKPSLFGWASELPALAQINTLPEHHRPKSAAPDFS